MIAKAIVHAPTRGQAFDAAARQMANAQVWPLTTNAAFLANLFAHPVVREGRATTALVEAELDALANASKDETDLVLAAAAIARTHLDDVEAPHDPWSQADGFRINGSPRLVYRFGSAGGEHGVQLINHRLVMAEPGAGAHGRVSGIADVDGRRRDYALHLDNHGPESLDLWWEAGGHRESICVRALAGDTVLFHRGRALALRRPEHAHALEGLEAGDEIRAPMPGKILEVRAKASQDVKKGDPLVVMEAMKMEHTLVAPRDGKIIEVGAKAGTQTAEGAILVRLEPQAE
jgi:acetyl/propionyl-CoA carboxylase alpha subunit